MSIDTVNDLPPRVQYVALAAQTVFPYTFPIFADADLDVYVDGVLKAQFTDYSVSGAGDDTGGNVTFTVAMVGGETVTIVRNIAIERDTDVSQNGPWSSTAYNNELDKVFLLLQQLKADFKRSIRIPSIAEVDDDDIEINVSAFANMYLAFDADGKPVPAALVAGTLTRAIIGQLFYPTSTAESAAVVVPVNFYEEYGHVKRYGAAVDGATDDIAALRSAISQSAQTTGAPVYIPDGTLIIDGGGAINTGIVALAARVKILGAGRERTTIKVASGSADRCGSIFSASGVDGWEIRDLTLDGNEAGLTQTTSHTAVYISGCSNWTIDNVKIKNIGTIPAAPEGTGGTHIIITVYESGATGLVAPALDVVGVAATGWRITNCHFDDSGFKSTFGIRPYSHFTSALADSAFTIFASGTIDNCLFDGFKWNPVELAGPGVRYCTVSKCESRGSRSYGTFEIDKGASYNRVVDCIARDYVVTKTDQYGFRIQGYPADGTAPNRYAIGNQLINCTVKNIAGTDANVPGGCWVSMARQTTIDNLDVFDVTTSTPSGAFSCAVRVDDATNTKIRGGTWRNVNIGVGPAGSATIDGLTVSEVDAETLYRFYTENGTSTRTRFHFSDCTIKVPGVAAFAVSSTSSTEISIVNNELFSNGAGSGNTGVSLPVTCVGTVLGNVFNDFNIGVDYSGGAAVNTNVQGNKFISCATNISGSNAVRNNMNRNFAIDAGGNCRAETFGTAAPGAGTWFVGDIVWNSAPAAAGTMGWVCTTAGTPGTWKTFGAIAA